VKCYNLKYADCVTQKTDAKVKKVKKYFFALFLKQLFLVIVCINVFVLVANFSFDSKFVFGVVEEFLPVDNNFGKLKYVDNVNNQYVHTNTTHSVFDFVCPFIVSYYDSKNDIFISAGNNILIAPVDATIQEIQYGVEEDVIVMHISDGCYVKLVGDILVGVQRGQMVHQHDNIGFAINGRIKVGVYINDKLVRNDEIF